MSMTPPANLKNPVPTMAAFGIAPPPPNFIPMIPPPPLPQSLFGAVTQTSFSS